MPPRVKGLLKRAFPRPWDGGRWPVRCSRAASRRAVLLRCPQTASARLRSSGRGLRFVETGWRSGARGDAPRLEECDHAGHAVLDAELVRPERELGLERRLV